MTIEEIIRIILMLCSLTTSKAIQQNLDAVIIGGTGDLAKRYLWKGLFNLYQEQYSTNTEYSHISLYGAGKSELSNEELQQIVSQSVTCDDLDTSCHLHRQNFISLCQYKTLRNDKDYEKLCTTLGASASDVIIYLSVPPKAYGSILQSIAKHCNMSNPSKDFKFAFEKPFGTDSQSAAVLSALIAKYLKEEQIYRVDHFLTDSTFSQILDFRLKNPLIEQMMNGSYVKRIEIVASETVGCEGRTSYYDSSGVLRDMLQNHLTEILCLVTKDLGESMARSNLLKSISTVALKDVRLAQYHGYTRQVLQEKKRKDSSTPTFANCRSLPQIAFVRRHSAFNSPTILISSNLPVSERYVPDGWIKTKNFHGALVFGDEGKCFRAFVPNTTLEHAYVKVIENLYKGNREDFVQTEALLESWRIWSPAVTSTDKTQNVITYAEGSSLETVLKFISGQFPKKCYVSNIFFSRCDV